MELAQSLRERGYRLTPQRQLVLEAVTELGHATPEDVHAWVVERAEGVNISTVYRTLELLEEIGLVTHAHLSHGAPTYHAGRRPPARPRGLSLAAAPSPSSSPTTSARWSRPSTSAPGSSPTSAT